MGVERAVSKTLDHLPPPAHIRLIIMPNYRMLELGAPSSFVC